jgi:hypothetical protein
MTVDLSKIQEIRGIWEGNQRLKCKMQNCGGPAGGFVLKKKKMGGFDINI